MIAQFLLGAVTGVAGVAYCSNKPFRDFTNKMAKKVGDKYAESNEKAKAELEKMPKGNNNGK